MRGTGRNLPSRILVGVFGQPFGLDGDRALIVIADEMDLLDVPLPEYGLHFRPFDLGRLDLSKPIELNAHTDDADKFFKEIDKFIVK